MKLFRPVAALLAAFIVSFSLLSPAWADLVYNPDTNEWAERSEETVQPYSRANPVPRAVIDYVTSHAPGTIIVETSERRLYLVLEDGKALRYGVGVGREGFDWAGTNTITRKAEWPGWTPPPEMRKRVPNLPTYMPGGPDNPLGARALYIGSTLYRIHGTSEPWTIGQAVSSGCIRMTNEDVIDLYERVRVGARVIVNR